jgi:hypothetical protein
MSIRKKVQACDVLRSAQPLPRHLSGQQGLCEIIDFPTVDGMKSFQVYKGSLCHSINVSFVKSRDCRNGRTSHTAMMTLEIPMSSVFRKYGSLK